jgi:hypothetical protein
MDKELFTRAEQYLMSNQVTLPGPSVLERLIISVCSQTHEKQFDDIFNMMSSELKNEIDKLLQVTYSNQRSPFYLLKEYPPSATVSSIKKYLERYKLLTGTGIDNFVINNIEPNFLEYLFQLGYFGTTPKKV